MNYIQIQINIMKHKRNSNFQKLLFLFLATLYGIYGIITGIMFLTREDNIWVILVYAILIIYKLYKNFKIKNGG